jgi:hypothetical protein
VAKPDELIKELWQRINARTGGPRPCPACDKTAWHIVSRFTRVPAITTPHEVVVGGPGFPMVPMVCTNCGYMRFFNMYVLGYSEKDLQEVKFEDEDGGKQ